MMRHHLIMRTTVDLPPHLLTEAKQLAAARRSSLTRIVEESLRAYLAAERGRPERRERAPLPIITDVKARRGVDLDDTSSLLEAD
jgi:hypothetical protein